MTMKTKKTLQHIAAVAVVLLTLCLVFAAPAGATEECTGCDNNDNEGHTHVAWTDESGSKTYYATISSAINAVSANGGTVYLMSGTITDAVDLRLPENTGDSVKTIKIYGVNHAQNPDEWSDSQTVLTGRIYLNFYGGDQDGYDFEIKGITFQGTGVSVYTRANITIQNNVFKDIATSESISAIHVSSGTNEGKVQKADISSNHFINVTKKGANGAVAILASKETCNDCITKDNFFDDGCLSASCGEGHAQHVAWIIDGSTTKYYATVSSALDAVAKDGGIIYLIGNTISEKAVSDWSGWETNDVTDSPKQVKIYGVNYGTTPDKWDDKSQTILTGGMDLGKNTGTITNYNVDVKGITFQTAGIEVSTKQNVVIENNKFSSTTSNAILMVGAGCPKEVQIINNQINGVSSGHGISITNSHDVEIKGNTIENTNEHSILLGQPVFGSVEITGNTLKNWGKDNKGRAVRMAINTGSTSITGSHITITNNAMIHDSLDKCSEQFIKISNLGENSVIDVSANYWNGAEPTSTFTGKSGSAEYYYMKESDGILDPAVFKTYYADAALTRLITLPITPDFDDVINAGEGSKEVTITVDGDTTTVEDNVVTVKDETNGVTMTMTFTSAPTYEGVDTITGTIAEVKVTYEEKTAEVSTSEGTGGTVEYSMVLDLTKAGIQLPTLNPAFDDSKADSIKGTDGLSGHTPLAMITATNTVAVNADMKANSGNQVAFTFKISKSLLNGKSMKYLVGYHIADDGKVTKIVPNSGDRKEENNYIYVTIYGDKFSTYAVGISDKEEEVVNTQIITGGSGKDTGSGNYQYYPRDIPTNGIVDFGTSKVVKGMELPAGSSGKVTLNTKPTFAMPENGFYAFEIDAPGYNLDAKINGGLSFQIPVADLEAEGFTANDIVLFHGTVAEDGKITWEALPTNLVKVENGIAYYKAAINGCSPFYIGFVEDGSIVNTEVVDPVTPPTEEPDVPGTDLPDIPGVQDEPEEPSSPAPILAVLAALGAAVVLRRK